MELVLPLCELIHREAKKLLYAGAVAVDATMGNGEDTAFLCEAVGANGKVYAFDIQEDALGKTRRRLENAGYQDRATLIKDGHENIRTYVKEAVAVAVFNLGYLPGGNHAITTLAPGTVRAIGECLTLLREEGAVLIGLYWGHQNGEEEKKAVEAFLTTLSPARWAIAETRFPNRVKAPLFIEIQKKRYGHGNKSIQTEDDSENNRKRRNRNPV